MLIQCCAAFFLIVNLILSLQPQSRAPRGSADSLLGVVLLRQGGVRHQIDRLRSGYVRRGWDSLLGCAGTVLGLDGTLGFDDREIGVRYSFRTS